MTHSGAILSNFPQNSAGSLALIGVVISEGADGTIHGISGTVQIVGMQPLIVLAASDTRPVSVADLHLLVVTISAFLDTELVVGVSE